MIKMTMLAIVGAVALVGCAKQAAAPSEPSGYVGTWSCTAQLSYKFTSPPNTPDKQVTLELTRTFTGAGKALESTDVSAAGTSTGCVTKWTVDGATATLDPDQTCTAKVTAPGGALREVTGRNIHATANLSGGTIHETGSSDLDVLEGATHLVGAGTTATTCTRKS